MFKNYAIVQDGVVIEYPVDPRVWLVSENTYNISEYWEGGELNGKTYVFCHNKEPAHAYDESLVEATPTFNVDEGLWYRRYEIVKVDNETLAERKQLAQDSADALLSRLFVDLDAMSQTISELSVDEQNKWQTYRVLLTQVPQQSMYPFEYELPFTPDYLQDLKIKVTRI